ncbi:MAG: DNA replication/repair protein RecF [Chitinophagaceae bacterium]
MSFLRQIQLIQYRNYNKFSEQFTQQIVCFCGKNGVGKTNLLDAIYSMCCCKSYFNRTDASNTTHELKGHRIDGWFVNQLDSDEKVSLIFRENNKKEICLNDVPYEKFSYHLGKFPCIMIAPDDVEIINGSSELRRKFIDAILSQTNFTYLQKLVTYNNILQQRNALLKQWQNQANHSLELIDVLNNQLEPIGNYIFNERKKFLENFIETVNTLYHDIAKSHETIELAYNCQLLETSFNDLLQKNLQQDIFLQRTTVGIHKDDIEILLNKNKFKQIASQGQKKSLLYALKVAAWQYIFNTTGKSPLLLLDDIFEKLDEQRLMSLLKIIIQQPNIQIFITHTQAEKLQEVFSGLNKEVQIINVAI